MKRKVLILGGGGFIGSAIARILSKRENYNITIADNFHHNQDDEIFMNFISKNNIKLFVSSCYLLTFSLIAYLFKESMGFNIFTLFLFMFFLSLIYQLFNFEQKKPSSCLETFKMNNFSGFILFLSLTLI